MSSVDERTVKMRFDNAQFKKDAADTKKSLDDVNSAADKGGKGSKGLLGLSGAMDTVKVKASAMQIAAVTAIATITNKAVNAGINIAKSLTLDPLKQGFDEYELKMKSIQTILANTKGENLKSVSASLAELNTYSDKTIYNFANMTENIGKLTTAGIGLKDATAVVKGFSNMAALSGTDATAAAGALEQFGQGLQAGSIKAIDWMSLSTRGMGSQNLQKAFFETAKAAGTLKDLPVGTTFEKWSKASGGFKASLEKGWLTTDVATKTLKIMTGDVKNVQQLMKQGFDKKTAQDMLKIADSALDSATKVRTFSSFMDTLKEQIGSGWGQVIEVLVGDFNEATALFTKLSNISGKAIGGLFNYLTALLKGWDEMGGRTAILKTIGHLLAPIGAILKVIAAAWTAAFPSGKAGAGLAGMSKGLEMLTRPLELLADLISGAVGPLTTFFRLIHIGVEVIKQAGGQVADFVGGLVHLSDLKAPGSGGMIGFIKKIASAISDAIKQVDNLLRKGASLGDAFGSVKMPDMPDIGGAMSKMPAMPAMPKLPVMGSIFGGGDGGKGKIAGLVGGIKSLNTNVDTLKKTSEGVSDGGLFNPDAQLDTSRMKDVGDQADQTTGQVKTMGDKVGPVFDMMKEKFLGFVQNFSMDDLMSSINLAALTTFMLSFSGMMKDLGDGFKGFASVGDGFAKALEGAGAGLKSFQTQAQADLILKLGIAIGILALSLWLLSRIPADKMNTALLGLGAIFLIMKGTMDELTDTVEKMDGKGVNMKMIAVATSMAILALALLLMAAALKKMNDVDWGSLVKGGIALKSLTLAMESIGSIRNEQILKTAFAMVVVSAALWVFATAIKKFADLDFGTFVEGMAYAAVALLTLTTALHGFESSLSGAAAMVVAVAALWLFVGVIKKFAELDFGTFAKGLFMSGAALMVLAIAMMGFTSSLPGALALIVAVGALWLMVGVIQAFSELDWGAFAKGMAMVTITFLVLGTLMALMGVFSPFIIAGAAALLIFGAALALAGMGISLMAKGIVALIAVSAGLAGLAVSMAMAFGIFLQTLALQAPIMKKSFLTIMQTLIDTIVEAVPMVIDGIKRLWAAVKAQFSGGEGEKKKGLMGDSGKSWITKLTDGIKAKMPMIVKKAAELIVSFINALTSKARSISAAATNLVAAVINGIASRLSTVIAAGVNLVVSFIRGIGDAAVKIAVAAKDTVVRFITALGEAIRTGGPEIGTAMNGLGQDMIAGLIGGLEAMAGDAMQSIVDLAGRMIQAAKDKFKIWSPSRVFMEIGKFLVHGLTKGIQDHSAAAISAVASMVGGQIAIANEYISTFIQKLDERALEARGKAQGLARAAAIATKAAKKTKTHKDDKAANAMTAEAKRADKAADAKEKKAAAEKKKQDKRVRWAGMTDFEKAKERSKDAQRQLQTAKDEQQAAVAAQEQAAALRKQAMKSGVTAAQRKSFREQAQALDKQAKQHAERANANVKAAKTSARDALTYQARAGKSAAENYQKQFDQEKAAAKEAKRFEALTDTQKAKERRDSAAALDKKSRQHLRDAKKLARTNLAAANKLAEQAMDEAEKARQYVDDAVGFETSAKDAGGTGAILDLKPTEAAAMSFNGYSNTYGSAYAAAASTAPSVEFNQYNTSPESLSPAEIYRQSHNLITYAANKLVPAA